MGVVCGGDLSSAKFDFSKPLPPVPKAKPRKPVDTNHPAYWLVNNKLRLVDLAGSEQNTDTGSMAAMDHRESGDINAALMALKDCIRKHKRAKPPFRAHLLTRIIRECFTERNHRTSVIATISPATVDTMHTLNTLNHVVLMQAKSPHTAPKISTGSGPVEGDRLYLEGLVCSLSVEVPLCEGGVGFNKEIADWTAEEVKEWIAVACGGKFSHIVLPPKTDGKDLITLNEASLGELFEAGREEIAARGQGEGRTWVISGVESEGKGSVDTGRELYQAIRIEQKHIEMKLRKEEKENGIAIH